MLKYEKVFPIIDVVLPTERSIFQGFYLNFKPTFPIFKEFMNDFWNDVKKRSDDSYFC